MEAIILAGGIGTRLHSVVKDFAKPMALVNGKPFLQYILNNLLKNDVTLFILSVGYKYKEIQDYFGDEYRSTPIDYAFEEIPLGTGGGIRESLELAHNSPVFVLNGDTFFDVDLDNLKRTHCNSGADVTLAVKQKDDLSRYGSVLFDETGRLIAFKEKSCGKNGYINGGVYVMNKDLFTPFPLTSPFSFETDFMEVYINDLNIRVLPCDAYFIDIGVPRDYYKARQELMAFDDKY
ncbi:nucleotidyltransferase family protein [Candidatus Latescibacterota bacterium]